MKKIKGKRMGFYAKISFDERELNTFISDCINLVKERYGLANTKKAIFPLSLSETMFAERLFADTYSDLTYEIHKLFEIDEKKVVEE